jgi:CDGSH-type Zn-finger protein
MGLFDQDRRRDDKKSKRPEPTPANVKVYIQESGPYRVEGDVKLTLQRIVPDGKDYRYETVGSIPHSSPFTLCRCGKSKNPPFCDGEHCKTAFHGEEIASRSPFELRARRQVGPGIDLLDDDRCAFARFCHTSGGNIWDMVKRSDDPAIRKLVIRAACDCPTGRLVAVDKETDERIEEKYEPEIVVLEDVEQEAGGPLFLKGYIQLFAADGTRYEVRNRMALCRCGSSEEMPFCDAGHLTFDFLPEIKTADEKAASDEA